jgi:hypothetical protein
MAAGSNVLVHLKPAPVWRGDDRDAGLALPTPSATSRPPTSVASISTWPWAVRPRSDGCSPSRSSTDAGHDVADDEDDEKAEQVRQKAEEAVERLLQAVADVHGSDDVHEMNSWS